MDLQGAGHACRGASAGAITSCDGTFGREYTAIGVSTKVCERNREGGVHMEVREAQAKKPACVFHQKYIPSTTCIRSMGQSTFTQAFKSADECVGGGTQWVAAF